MEIINSRSFTLKKDVQTVYGIASKPSILSGVLAKIGDKLPLKDVSLTDDSFAFDAPMVGQVKFVRSADSTPSMIRYKAENAAIPLSLLIHMKETGEHTDMQLSIEADIPSFLKGMVMSKLSPALEKAADTLEKVDFDRLKF
ncbi:hypothetical protein [Porphyromonas sp.]|uniref:hypothetical protein n=1 Tax=Porphyromonas sp. TaxID=1924944 RepID=UPI0026DB2CB8|nr:hypothetical protein [Porphyromonas sp.]MDO4771470.1 hypothetical protein [Porphyromonas sp.]